MHPSHVDEKRGGRLWELADEMLSQRRLILASNRGPVDHQIGQDGKRRARRGSGGIVTALSALTNHLDFTWIASAMGEGDRQVATTSETGAIQSPIPGQRFSMRYVVTPRRLYHKYYNVICNPLLWFLQHYMWSSPYTPIVDDAVYDAWETGYVPMNQAFAQAIITEAQQHASDPFVMIHDYHLYLVPGFIRKELPKAIIQHFIHIPWPTPVYWQLIPAGMRQAICESLCCADILGFQSMRDTRSFLESCAAFLPDAQTDHSTHQIHFNGHTTRVHTYPISIDVEEVRKIATTPRAQEYERHLQTMVGEMTLVRVDRAEPSKNIVRGFLAFHALLHRHPELHGRIRCLAFLVPSRTHIRQYQRYLDEIDSQVQSINATFGTSEWKPISVFYENNYTQAIAGMRLYDVLLVNPVIDGMNLVAKEGPVVNTRNGVLILSETAGAFEQLQTGAIAVAPADVEGTTQALYKAFTMSPEERARRSASLVEVVEREDVTHWLYRQLADIWSLATPK